MPVYINAGLTDSKRPDAQAGLETGFTLATGAAAGAGVFGHMGICGVDRGSSLDMLALQNEVHGSHGVAHADLLHGNPIET
jgi:trimethylamine:corrinoid methyltransferase-like protein